MTETELVALVPLISEPLSMSAHRMDLESFSTIMDWVFTPVKAHAYDAFEDLQELLAKFMLAPEGSGVTDVEWRERRREFIRAVEMYLEERFPVGSGARVQ
jgi:hypothetical protein